MRMLMVNVFPRERLMNKKPRWPPTLPGADPPSEQQREGAVSVALTQVEPDAWQAVVGQWDRPADGAVD